MVNDLIQKLTSLKLLKKNKNFQWMNSFYFHSNGDVFFGNLLFMVRLIKVHDLTESKTIDTSGEELDEANTKVYELFLKGVQRLKGQSPLINVVSNVETDKERFKIMDSITGKDEHVLCYIENKKASLNYISDITRNKTILEWTPDREGKYFTFLEPKLLMSIMKVFDESDTIQWSFFEDPLPFLIMSSKVQIICSYGKDMPDYFQEYVKKPRTRKKKVEEETLF